MNLRDVAANDPKPNMTLYNAGDTPVDRTPRVCWIQNYPDNHVYQARFNFGCGPLGTTYEFGLDAFIASILEEYDIDEFRFINFGKKENN
jgi:hypothetical protein